MTNAEIDDGHSLTALPDGLRQKFEQAEGRRETRNRFWFWTLIVSTVLCGMGAIAWAISKF